MGALKMLVIGFLVLGTPNLSWSQSIETTSVIDISEDLRTAERFKNFGVVYGAQWAFYLVSQEATIREHGSFHNWTTNPWNPTFDKDTYDYNVFKHALAGQYYYQFYRYRGYSQSESFLWSFASSLAFEFTIETVTEKPSLQDIYQTPVFGAVVGVGFENLSRYLHSLDTWYAHTLAYILNPFPLLSTKNISSVPWLEDGKAGAIVSWSY